jgi:hypothetical protein
MAKSILFLLAALTSPLAAAEFVVISAVGVVGPEGLEAGQELASGTQLTLERWGRALVRETSNCQMTHVIAGIGDYTLTLSEDCSAGDDAMTVAGRIQQGETFVAKLKQTDAGQADDLIQALSNEPCVFMDQVSEEGTGERECPSGYALRGLRCSGSYCDNKDMLCCPYLGGAADPTSKEMISRPISEEFPNSLQSKRFFNGLICTGPYCDNIQPLQFKSGRLVNTRDCRWTVWQTEREGQWLDCQLGRFAAGIRCQDEYCGDIALQCCTARVD